MKKRKRKKAKKGFPIHYFSDLFIAAMVVFWIADNLWETIIATSVTIASIRLSMEAGYANFDTTMWASIGQNVALPISVGGGMWMLKNGINHYWAGKNNTVCEADINPPDDDDDPEDCEEEINESEADG